MILRNKNRDRYTQIDNRTVRDPRLSWKARGILMYLLSMPDGWNANIRDLAKRSPDGEVSVSSGMKELERFGYLVRSKKSVDGTWLWEIEVIETPENQPCLGFADTQNINSACRGFTDTQNPDIKKDLPKKELSPFNPPGGVSDFSEAEEIAEEEQAPTPATYPVIPNLSKEKTPRIAADHPTFLQDWERIWKRYNAAKPSTPKTPALNKAKKLTLDQWHTFKETFPSWAEEWERKAAAGESQYIPNLTTYLNQGRYTEPFRAGKGIVPTSTQKPGYGPPEGFLAPFADEPDRIGKYQLAAMEILRDFGVVTEQESFSYLNVVASSSLQISMGKQALTADYEYIMEIDERVRVWHDEKGGREQVREYLAKKKAEQGDDDEEYD
jgi:hypothetical protein